MILFYGAFWVERKLAIMSERWAIRRTSFLQEADAAEETLSRATIYLSVGSAPRFDRGEGRRRGQQEDEHHKLHKEIRQNTSLIKGPSQERRRCHAEAEREWSRTKERKRGGID